MKKSETNVELNATGVGTKKRIGQRKKSDKHFWLVVANIL
jgi:hypothetical protein